MKTIGMIFLYLVFIYAAGTVLCRLLRLREGHIVRLVYGYFFYFLLFFIVAILPKIFAASLTLLTVLWTFVLIAILILAIILWKKEAFSEGMAKTLRRTWGIRLCLALPVILLVLLCNANADYISLWDAAYYIGDVNTSLYTDSISAYDPYTGNVLTEVSADYFLEVLQNHSAVMCRLFSVEALIEVRTVLFSVNLIVFYAIVILFSRFFFAKHIDRQFLFLLLFILYDLFTYNLHTRSQILLMRGYEGKAVAANIIIFGLLYVLARIFRTPTEKSLYALGTVVSAASFGLNMTSIMLVPALIFALTVPYFFATWKKTGTAQKKTFAARVLVMVLPMLLPMSVYLSLKFLY